MLDPDPYQMITDLKHWLWVRTYVSGDEAWLGGHGVTVPHGEEEGEVRVTQAEQPVTKASETMMITVTNSVGNIVIIHHRKAQ
jgi:hypothetical protein